MTEQKLRIAVLGTRGIPDVMGGVETHCQALYPRLAAKGHSITLFARKGYVQAASYIYNGVSIKPIWTLRKKSLEAIIHTLSGIVHIAFRRNKYDLVHIHGIGPALLAPIARLFGLKVVITHHGADYERQKWGRLARTLLRLGERFGCIYAHTVITVSKHIKKSIYESFKTEGIYIPNGVLLPNILQPAEHVHGWSLTPKKYILAVGRFVPEKGFHDLLKAFNEVKTDWKLVIAGDADHADDYSKKLKAEASCDDRVVLTGFIKGAELNEIYSNAGLFVLPSYHEGLPIALLEAMSYNLSMLVTDIPANRELVNEDEVFSPGDIKSLVRRLQSLLVSPPNTKKKRRIIETEFNWDIVADLTEQAYWSCVSTTR